MREGFGNRVHVAGGERRLLQAQRPEQSILHRPGQRLAIDALRDEAEQRIVRIVVLESRPRREVGRVRESDRQQFFRRPDPGRIAVGARREFGGVQVVVEAAAHLQQFGEGDVLAVGHTRHVFRHRVSEFELSFLRHLDDHRGRHRLGVRGDPEMRVGAGRGRSADLRGAVGDRELPLRCAQEHDGARE